MDEDEEDRDDDEMEDEMDDAVNVNAEVDGTVNLGTDGGVGHGRFYNGGQQGERRTETE